MCNRRGVRADLGADGFANGDGGMMMRGDSGRVLDSPAALLLEATLLSLVLESEEWFRDSDGCELGGLVEDLGPEYSEALSDDRSKLFSLKLNRALVVDAGL